MPSYVNTVVLKNNGNLSPNNVREEIGGTSMTKLYTIIIRLASCIKLAHVEAIDKCLILLIKFINIINGSIISK